MNALICKAVTERKRVRFDYAGGNRVVEVHLYGQDASGEEYIRAYQVSGHSVSGVSSGWKLFRAAEISSLALTEEEFTGPRAGYSADDPVLKTIFCQL